LIIKSFEANSVLFVNFGVFHKSNFSVSHVESSEPRRFLWVNDCIVLELDKLKTVKSAKSFFVLLRLVMFALVVNWSEVSRVLEELIKVLLRESVSPVRGWSQVVLSNGPESDVVFYPSKRIAKNTIKAAWSFLNSHLWSGNREVVSDFVLSKVAVLNHSSS